MKGAAFHQEGAEGNAVVGVFVSLTGKGTECQWRADRMLLFWRSRLNASFFQAQDPLIGLSPSL